MLFTFRVCRVVSSVYCSLVVTCGERADLLAILCVMFSCVFVTFPCGVLFCRIVSIPDLCLLAYFHQASGLCSSYIYRIFKTNKYIEGVAPATLILNTCITHLESMAAAFEMIIKAKGKQIICTFKLPREFYK